MRRTTYKSVYSISELSENHNYKHNSVVKALRRIVLLLSHYFRQMLRLLYLTLVLRRRTIIFKKIYLNFSPIALAMFLVAAINTLQK